MKINLSTNFTIDKENSKITINREFVAPVARVWAAWTQSDLLEKWWAPRPWRAKTKTMKFEEGGFWLYAMVGPEGEEHWGKAQYHTIIPLETFSAKDAFCDSDGVINTEFPQSRWNVAFHNQTDSTAVRMEISFDTFADLEKTLEMGAKEGLISALENLDELLQQG